MNFKEHIDLTRLPKHVAVIMDGNGRWANQKGKFRIFGHENGVKAVKDTVEMATELGIKYLTMYAFSTENWTRPKEEVDALMSLLVKTIHHETPTLIKNNVRLLAIGNLKLLPDKCYKELMEAIDVTKNNTRTSLVLALSYSSHWEILNAAKNIALKVKNNELNVDDINQENFEKCLTTSNIPNPELLIRTSGEYRISNFLLWQIAYTELYFTNKLWPDFNKQDFCEAIVNYQNRERRFGKTSEQIKNPKE